MTKSPNPLSAAIAIAALMTGWLTGALAQSSADPPWHMMQGGPVLGTMGGNCPTMGTIMYGEDVPPYSEGRLAFLRTELAITDAQNTQWDAYASALRINFQSMHDMRRTMKTPVSDMTPVERLDAHLTAMRGRLKALEEVKPSLAALYTALSADQKKKADQLLTQMGCMM